MIEVKRQLNEIVERHPMRQPGSIYHFFFLIAKKKCLQSNIRYLQITTPSQIKDFFP